MEKIKIGQRRSGDFLMIWCLLPEPPLFFLKGKMPRKFNIQSPPLSRWDKKISFRFTPQVRALLLKDNLFLLRR